MRKKLFDTLANPGDYEVPVSGMFAMSKQFGENIIGEPTIKAIVTSLEEGCIVDFVNKGYWNMHELLMQLLGYTGPAHLMMSTYAVSETAARTLALLRQEKQLLSICALIDNRVDTRSAGSLQLLRSISDRISLAPCHAKVTLLSNEEHSITIVGSANYTENKRYETGFISSSPATCTFHKQWIQEAMNEHGQYNP